jgi:hypothetical protein
MATKKNQNTNESGDAAVAVGGVALVAAILGNLAQHSKNQDLHHQVEALQCVVADWQVAYRSLENQLTLALDVNVSLNDQVSGLRNELRSAQERVYTVEKRALAAEEQLRQTKEELAKAAQLAREGDESTRLPKTEQDKEDSSQRKSRPWRSHE